MSVREEYRGQTAIHIHAHERSQSGKGWPQHYHRYDYTYDALSRLETVTYPETYGLNGLTTATAWDRVNGFIKTMGVTTASGASLRGSAYLWSATGHLNERIDITSGARDIFHYDALDRLTDVYENSDQAPPVASAQYHADGRIESRSGNAGITGKMSTMQHDVSLPWRRDSNETASDKAGAIQACKRREQMYQQSLLLCVVVLLVGCTANSMRGEYGDRFRRDGAEWQMLADAPDDFVRFHGQVHDHSNDEFSRKNDEEPKPIVVIEPKYPDRARENCISGWVLYEFLIDQRGGVSEVNVVAQDESRVFAEIGEAALLRWKFKPAVRDAERVSARYLLPIEFTAPACEPLPGKELAERQFQRHEQSYRPDLQGTVYAVVKITNTSDAEFLVKPASSRLPQSLMDRVTSSLLAKARAAHTVSPREDGVYWVAIDWKAGTQEGKEMLEFDYHSADPVPIRREEPVYPRTDIREPIEIDYRITLSADGTVTDVRRADGDEHDMDFYQAGREALMHWRFMPRFKDGIGVSWDVQIPFTFGVPASPGSTGPGKLVQRIFPASGNR